MIEPVLSDIPVPITGALPWTNPSGETGNPWAERHGPETDLCWPLQRHSAGEAILLDLLAG